ncbi:hypothetical protein G5C60_43640 [Streptomyces sp. HC44]|uniref:Uncharacterized protein n=1 Tax=Streptomyces scabichelini TaxID=2711217 RepID=A0A6G4VJL7_9ACTN|nr:hypothetical protein [Streptomyces scabichelini]
MRVAALGLSTPGTSAPKTVRGVRLTRLTSAQSSGTVLRDGAEKAREMARPRVDVAYRAIGLLPPA